MMNHSLPTSESIRNRFVYFVVLAILLLLFCFRVGAQFLVANGLAPFLPPMDEWFSGFIQYPQLLVLQLLIIILYANICRDFLHGRGYFVTPNKQIGKLLFNFGVMYFLIMALRYIFRMALYPTERWVGGSIPIFFHLVLSSFLITLALYHKHSCPPVKAPVSEKRTEWCIKSFIAILTLGWLAWQILPAALALQFGLGLPVYAVRIHKDVLVPLHDGVTLNSEVYSPEHVNKTPTLLVRIPLTKSLKNDIFVSLISRIWAEHGYTVVIQGTRGRFGSEGIFCPLKGERSDGLETLAWLKIQPWYNGQCVLWGGSSFGYTALSICDSLNLNASAIEVYESSSNFRKMFYPGGAFALSSALSWAINSHGKQDLPDWPDAASIIKSADGLPVLDSDERAVGQQISFFREWCEHDLNDSFWKLLDVSKRLSESKAPVLFIAGWYDPFLPSQLEDFSNLQRYAKRGISEKSRLIIGPWTHAGELVFPNGQKAESFRIKSVVSSLPFFDSILGRGSTPSSGSPVCIFVMGKNSWRNEHEWPLARTSYVPFFLDSDGKTKRWLTLTCPGTETNFDQFTYDPNNPVPSEGGAVIGAGGGIKCQNEIESRSDVLVYTSPPLAADLEVTGQVNAQLFVKTSAAQTDFTVKLVDVYPSGAAYNICDGILRRSFNHPARSVQGKGNIIPCQIKVELWPTSIVLCKGHRIRVEISSSNFPHYDRNLNCNTFSGTSIKFLTARQTVFYGGSFPSRIILPVIFSSTKGRNDACQIGQYFDSGTKSSAATALRGRKYGYQGLNRLENIYCRT